MMNRWNNEWLEADGLGGFASGTVGTERRRRYHALLQVARRPPTERMVLVNGFEAWLETPDGRSELTSQRYAPDVVAPDVRGRIADFHFRPWPCWIYRLDGDGRLQFELFAPHGKAALALIWRMLYPYEARLCLRPFLSGRDYHSTHHENPHFRMQPEESEGRLTWKPYPGVPSIALLHNGRYHHDPVWYRRFRYAEETERGLDDIEDLAAPGVLSWPLKQGKQAQLLLTADVPGGLADSTEPCERLVADLQRSERRRRAVFPSKLHQSADNYIVRRGEGRTVIAGYPWFTDWGRDSFIALRGLALSTGRYEVAKDILLEWSGQVKDGLLPNFFPDADQEPEYNSVDAPLWYAVAVHECLRHCRLTSEEETRLQEAVSSIIEGMARGTRHGIGRDDDGLLACGEPGVQLTWMDAKVGDWVVTPRIGKPVEVQALWINALQIAAPWNPRCEARARQAIESFRERFWSSRDGYLYDVVDVNHRSGDNDNTLRPNQILAVGGLPFPLFQGPRAAEVVEAVERSLLTPMGLRSLDPGHQDYRAHYGGSVWSRDSAYHQGTVWPWLMGPFVEAWLRVHGDSSKSRLEARERFLQPLLDHLDQAGLGHVSEIADGDAPFAPRGCPFQAWSLGEILRLKERVLAERDA
ncbi:MAG TPA: amylo-alpha-1,6-glucosidase [Acidobacteriota bacterium]|nr:amylo-alpha-1,6-glucosidase [Acidobacteriota bacterium]